MYRGRDRDEWSRLSYQMALNANMNRDPKSKSYTPDDFDIYDKDGRLKKPRKVKTPRLSEYFPKKKG